MPTATPSSIWVPASRSRSTASARPSLSAGNFAFEQTPVVQQRRTIIIGDGAMLPISGVVNNSGTIVLAAAMGESDLELIQHGITLTGGGHVVLSDNAGNVIFGSASDVDLTNVDNIISGAGNIGGGSMVLIQFRHHHRRRRQCARHRHRRECGRERGTLESTGAGGMTVQSGVDNPGNLWANGGNILVKGAVTGAGCALISGMATLEFGAASSANTTFDAGAAATLKLDDSFTSAARLRLRCGRPDRSCGSAVRQRDGELRRQRRQHRWRADHQRWSGERSSGTDRPVRSDALPARGRRCDGTMIHII
jgi:hypothetical protein